MSEPETTQQTQAAQPATVEKPRGLFPMLLRAYCWMLIFGVVYVLSIGPMYSAWYDARHMGHGSRFVLLLYSPLAIACETFKPLDDWVAWYLTYWI